MNESPSTWMLLHFAPNSTLFTSLPLTIGLTYGLLMLTILSLTLSRGLLFSKWAFCWRYTLVMISISLFCLTVSNFSAPAFSLSSVRVSFSIFPKRLSRRQVSFLVWTFVCLRRFLYDRLAFSTSTYFVLGRCTFSLALRVHIISYDFSIPSHRSFGSVG